MTIRFISKRIHAFLDYPVAVTLIVSPFIFGFTGIDAWFYWANGITVLCVVSLHKAESNTELRSA